MDEKGDGIDEGRGPPIVVKGVAHSNMLGERGKSSDSLLGHRESTEEEGTEDRRRNLGLHSRPKAS